MSDIPLMADEGEHVGVPGRKHNAGQYRPGSSGNPKGRPPKKIETRSIIEQALFDPVEITVNGKKKSVTYLTALLMSLKQQALKGSVKAAQLLLKACPPDLLETIDQSAREQEELDRKKRALLLDHCDEATLMQLREASKKVAAAFPTRPKRPRARR